MDALALLCTLHADGPSTLKNLRQAGCGSLEAIESMEEERLSQVLGAPPAVARRFVREARHLRERLDPAILDREETHLDPPTDAAGLAVPSGSPEVETPTVVFDLAARLGLSNVVPASPARNRTTASPAEARMDAARRDTDPGESDPRVFRAARDVQRDPMADVLEAWRARDELLPPEASVPAPVEVHEALDEEVPPRPVRARPEFEFGAEIVAAMRDLTTTVSEGGPQLSLAPIGAVRNSTAPIKVLRSHLAPTEASGSHPMDEPLVEGLSALIEGQESELALRLGEEGIGDLRELTDADVLALSERFGFGYTRILRLVQLARRAATDLPESSTAAFGAGVLRTDDAVPTFEALPATKSTPKLSPADRPRSQRSSILELEWNLEIQPQAPPRDLALPDATIPDARREGAGGPFA